MENNCRICKVFRVSSKKLRNVCWQIRHVYIHVYCNQNISAYYSKMRGFLSANPLLLSCNVLETMVLQLISFYTSWLAENVDKHRDQRGTPRPTNMPNWNENHSDNYLFMTLNTLEMTLMNCYQYTVSHNHQVLTYWIKGKSTPVAVQNPLLSIYNILHLFPQRVGRVLSE